MSETIHEELEKLNMTKFTKRQINTTSFKFSKTQTFTEDIIYQKNILSDNPSSLIKSGNLEISGFSALENTKVNNLYVEGVPVFKSKPILNGFPILSELDTPSYLSFDLYKFLGDISQVNGSVNSTDKNWASVALSSSGEFQSAVVYGGKIWLSDDYGETWTEQSVSNLNWNFIAVSSDAKYQSAVVYGGKIYRSENYGITWNATNTENLDWKCIAMSADGKYQTAVVYYGRIWISNDFGVSWNYIIKDPVFPNDMKNFTSVSVNYNGEFQTVVGMSCDIYRSSNFGVTWTSIPGTSKSWSSVAINYTGELQTAVSSNGRPYLSKDFGLTWNIEDGDISDFNKNWVCVAMNSTGKYQVALALSNKEVWKSRDFGENWTLAFTEDLTFKCLATSTSGQITVIGSTQKLYSSYSNLVLKRLI